MELTNFSGTFSSPTVAGFEQAAHAVLVFFQRRIGMGLWMATRKEGDDWIILHPAGMNENNREIHMKLSGETVLDRSGFDRRSAACKQGDSGLFWFTEVAA